MQQGSLPYYFSVKDPAESKFIGIDPTIRFLDTDDGLDPGRTPTVEVRGTADNVVLTACTITNGVIYTKVTGGTVGTTYSIVFTYYTLTGQVVVETIYLPVNYKA